MTTEPSPPGLRDAVGELIGELGSLLPRLFERSRDQVAVVSKLIEQLPCLGALAGRAEPSEESRTPDLHVIPGGAGGDDADVESADDAPVVPPAVVKAPARKAVAKKAPAARKAPVAKKAPAARKASVAKKTAAKRAPAKKSPAKKAPAATGALAIPDYDQLAASQVIPRLDSLTSGELEAIRGYESANRGRRTILSRIAQLETA